MSSKGKWAVKLFLIYPIQAIFPTIACFSLWRLLLAVKRESRSRTWRGFAGVVLSRMLRQGMRFWSTLELLFAAWYFVRRRQLEKIKTSPIVPGTREERRALAMRCLDAIDEIDFGGGEDTEDADRSLDEHAARIRRSASEDELRAVASVASVDMESLLRHWEGEDIKKKKNKLQQIAVQKLSLKRAAVSGWFLGADLRNIRQGNVLQWVAWAFFLKRRAELSDDEHGEAMALVQQMADWAELDLSPGFNPEVKCIRLEFDALQSSYRPLVFYLVTAAAVSLGTDLLIGHWLGFEKLKNGHLTYWHRPPRRRRKDGIEAERDEDGDEEEPIVFCHGLGVGPVSYLTLLVQLINRLPRRRIIAIELPHISMRPVETQASPKELVTSIASALAAHRVKKAHFVGHSFGSLVLTWICRLRPELPCRLTFLDPVCFLLCKHDVAYNFLHKPPSNTIEQLMQWFVGRELYIAYTLSRRFWWQSNILWPEMLPAPTTVVLSSEDHIVPSVSVRRFLESWEKRRRREEAGFAAAAATAAAAEAQDGDEYEYDDDNGDNDDNDEDRGKPMHMRQVSTFDFSGNPLFLEAMRGKLMSITGRWKGGTLNERQRSIFKRLFRTYSSLGGDALTYGEFAELIVRSYPADKRLARDELQTLIQKLDSGFSGNISFTKFSDFLSGPVISGAEAKRHQRTASELDLALRRLGRGSCAQAPPQARRKDRRLRHAVKVEWLDGLGHAGFLLHPREQARVVDVIVQPHDYGEEK